MAELHDLRPSAGSTHNTKRVGRGQGSGLGKTAGRGQDGQKSRSGGKVRRDFEGGQMPLTRRIPKRGFTNINRIDYQVVNVRDLARIEGDVGPVSLKAAGLIASLRKPVKILAEGDAGRAFTVSAHKVSKAAQAKIEAAGGSVSLIASAAGDAS
jgi:large subunit ribosomal protein L15